MKISKKQKFFSILLVVLFSASFAGCCHNGSSNNGVANSSPISGGLDSTHTECNYTEFPYPQHLASEATCEKRATYYYACICGEKSAETYEYGELADHKIVNDICTVCGYSDGLGLKYELSEDETYYTIIDKGSFTGANLLIPTLYNKKTVKAIAQNAFANCSTLTSLTVPDGIVSIGKSAFSDCNYLRTVTLGNSLNSIEDYAFSGCLITTATIPTQAIPAIPKNNLKKVVFTSGEKIPQNAFYNCPYLTEVSLSDTILSIGSQAFKNCKKLTTFAMGKNVISIENGAFAECDALTDFTVDEKVSSISYSVFSGCDKLTNVILPKSLTSIGTDAFFSCSQLKNIYYTGTLEDWENISIGNYNTALNNATRYYFSETTPTGEGNFWHYQTDGKTPVIW